MKRVQFYVALSGGLVESDGKITLVSGYSDGKFCYYQGDHRQWFCVVPGTGLSIGQANTLKALLQKVPYIEQKLPKRMQMPENIKMYESYAERIEIVKMMNFACGSMLKKVKIWDIDTWAQDPSLEKLKTLQEEEI